MPSLPRVSNRMRRIPTIAPRLTEGREAVEKVVSRREKELVGGWSLQRCPISSNHMHYHRNNYVSIVRMFASIAQSRHSIELDIFFGSTIAEPENPTAPRQPIFEIPPQPKRTHQPPRYSPPDVVFPCLQSSSLIPFQDRSRECRDEQQAANVQFLFIILLSF